VSTRKPAVSRLNQDKATADEFGRRASLRLREQSERQHRLKDPSTLDWVALKLMAKDDWKMEALEHALWHSPIWNSARKGMPGLFAPLTRWQATRWQPCIAAPNGKVQEQKKARVSKGMTTVRGPTNSRSPRPGRR